MVQPQQWVDRRYLEPHLEAFLHLDQLAQLVHRHHLLIRGLHHSVQPQQWEYRRYLEPHLEAFLDLDQLAQLVEAYRL